MIGIIGLLGLMMGSFAGATVWRLRAYQLLTDSQDGESVSKSELERLKKLTKHRFSKDRSRCLYCGHTLAWYDLLPLLSWLQLGGKCRYCKEKIGWFEPVIELGTAAFFVISFLAWPDHLDDILAVSQFVLWLVGGTGLIILFAYDARWFLLPNKIMFPVIGVASLSAVLHIVNSTSLIESAVSIAAGIGILSGLYLVLYLLSRGAWIGFGDIKLGLALALLLADWRLSLLTLFLANLIGSLVILPALITKKITRSTRVPFGPFLIVGAFAAGLWGDHLISWYLVTVLGL